MGDEESGICVQCKREVPLVQLSQCSRCKTATYCSQACQTSHWPTHKPNCKLPKKHGFLNYCIHAGFDFKQIPISFPLSFLSLPDPISHPQVKSYINALMSRTSQQALAQAGSHMLCLYCDKPVQGLLPLPMFYMNETPARLEATVQPLCSLSENNECFVKARDKFLVGLAKEDFPDREFAIFPGFDINA